MSNCRRIRGRQGSEKVNMEEVPKCYPISLASDQNDEFPYLSELLNADSWFEVPIEVP